MKKQEPSGPACEVMEQRVLVALENAAQGWAHHAYLRSCAVILIEEFGTVEDALLTCMIFQAMMEE